MVAKILLLRLRVAIICYNLREYSDPAQCPLKFYLRYFWPTISLRSFACIHICIDYAKLGDEKKMLQVSMDGPNVNLKFLKDLKAFLKNDKDQNDVELFDIGTCSLHVVHGAYKTAHNACGWKFHVFLRSLYYLFKDFPSRRSDYTNASKS